MKVTKWVDFGLDVDVSIDADDIAAALCEAVDNALRDPLGESPNIQSILRTFNTIATFLRGVTDMHISALTPAQRRLIHDFLSDQFPRYKEKA